MPVYFALLTRPTISMRVSVPGSVANADVTADGIGAAEVALRERLVDDGDAVGPALGKPAIVAIVELAAGDDAHAHRLEEARADGVGHRAGALARRRLVALDREAHAPAAAAEKRLERVADRRHTWCPRQSILERLREGPRPLRVVAARFEMEAETTPCEPCGSPDRRRAGSSGCARTGPLRPGARTTTRPARRPASCAAAAARRRRRRRIP